MFHMTALSIQESSPFVGRAERAIRRVLVVDDSRAQRMVLLVSLRRQGYSVVEAESGDVALALIRAEPPDLILSDWMMPGMDGLELCRQVRDLQLDQYVYFILLTSKSDKEAVAEGLDVGADDFLSKPVSADELRARINAGDRVLRMERELGEKNRLISSTLAEIRGLYDDVGRDLIEARKMQQSLVRDRYLEFDTASVSLLLKPSGHVGGDLVGCFRAGENRVAMYSIDVSGHGIASALLTARLSSYLSDGAPGQNIALVLDTDGQYVARPPQEVATLLNLLMLEELGSQLYFTLVLGYVDLTTGVVDLTQCGHPNPVLVSAEDRISYIGRNGMPVGLLEEAEFTQWQLELKPGDRLLFYSDGFTECVGHDGEMLEEDGFEQMIARNSELDGNDFLEALVWDLDMFCGSADFADDLSCALVEFHGENGRVQPK